jgi:hypothetical protein
MLLLTKLGLPKPTKFTHAPKVIPIAINKTSHIPPEVKKAVVPEVLQISEMQRLGVEHCQIPPEELTEARLRQVRSE